MIGLTLHHEAKTSQCSFWFNQKRVLMNIRINIYLKCHNKVLSDEPTLKQYRSFPAYTKHLYNIYSMRDHSEDVGGRCIDAVGLQMFLLPLGPSNPSARWARRGIVIPFVRRRRRTHSFGYYTNMVQQIKFIIHTNIQPLPALFSPKVKSQSSRSRSKI